MLWPKTQACIWLTGNLNFVYRQVSLNFFFFQEGCVWGEKQMGGREAPYEAAREDRRKHML